MSALNDILEDLAASTRDFIAALEGVTAAEWHAHPEPGRWSIGETAEHTGVVLRGVERLCTNRLLGMPLESSGSGSRISDADIGRLLADRSRTIEAPDMVKPKGRWPTREEFTAVFTTSTEGLIGWARTHAEELRSVGAPHPVLGLLDGLQWVKFVAVHTNRHAKQVEELRSA
jgi:DinB superfamily